MVHQENPRKILFGFIQVNIYIENFKFTLQRQISSSDIK